MRIFFYLEDRERTLDTATEKVMLSLTNFAAEMEREKARQRTHDALLRKARSGHVPGGMVYGYRNVVVPGPGGTRSHVVREVVLEQAAVLVRMYRCYAEGAGLRTIAARLNAEGAPSPRAHGWAPSAIREMLRCEAYRGVLTWNRTETIIRRGTEGQLSLPRFGGHSRSHESAVGVVHGETEAASVHEGVQGADGAAGPGQRQVHWRAGQGAGPWRDRAAKLGEAGRD